MSLIHAKRSGPGQGKRRSSTKTTIQAVLTDPIRRSTTNTVRPEKLYPELPPVISETESLANEIEFWNTLPLETIEQMLRDLDSEESSVNDTEWDDEAELERELAEIMAGEESEESDPELEALEAELEREGEYGFFPDLDEEDREFEAEYAKMRHRQLPVMVKGVKKQIIKIRVELAEFEHYRQQAIKRDHLLDAPFADGYAEETQSSIDISIRNLNSLRKAYAEMKSELKTLDRKYPMKAKSAKKKVKYSLIKMAKAPLKAYKKRSGKQSHQV
ncbi:hypothetical protein FUAX_11450 [Fulvitalea axinellae]|uniref:Uncharacterized protein n=1 Tax=Fulvitalea axinellae TaxID=1182444 RepID=A0AAU9CFI2_9BACT|nr:hypothetical protein FUAX_11450 [Fulvitalea axinellae]